MYLSIFAALITGGIAIAALSGLGQQWFNRHYRRGALLRHSVVMLALGLFLAHLASLLLPAGGLVADLCVSVTLAGLVGAGAVFARHRVSVPRTHAPRRVLALGAHPDDLEIACGGTLARFVDAGHEVHALVMSHGQVGGDHEKRPGEARAGARFMGLVDVQIRDYPDTELARHNMDMVAAIEAKINEISPDIVLTHSEHDHHQDHHAVHLATLRAGRRHSSILCFESPSSTRKFNPSVFVDIGQYIDVKIHAVGTHKNQAGKPYMSADRVRGVAAFRGTQAKQQFAEGFEPVRFLSSATGDL